MFNRKYHYVKVNNFEYLCIPNQSHIVHVFDAKKYSKTSLETLNHDSDDEYDDEKTESVQINLSNSTLNPNPTPNPNQNNIIQSAHSFTTFAPATIQSVTS